MGEWEEVDDAFIDLLLVFEEFLNVLFRVAQNGYQNSIVHLYMKIRQF